MALRRNTIEFACVHEDAAVAAGVPYDFAPLTVYVPEVDSRTFRAATIEVCARQNDAAAVSLTSWLIGVDLDGAGFDSETKTDTLTHSSEHAAWIFRRDVTAYFNANFGAGASAAVTVRVAFGAVSVNNICARLILSYEYDDAAAGTRIKTVRIPLDSPVASLSAAYATIDTIPQLTGVGGFLPESSPVIRDEFLILESGESVVGGATTTDFGIDVRLDGAGVVASEGLRESALATSCHARYIVKDGPLPFDPATSHTIEAQSSLASRFNLLTPVLYVTYEYDHAASVAADSDFLNSLVLALDADTVIGGQTAAEQSRGLIQWFVEEPGPVTLARSAVIMRFSISDEAPATLNVMVGAQGWRAYTPVAGTAGNASPGQLCQRFDAGAAGGDAGYVLARGLNAIEARWYRTGVYPSAGVSVVALINYYSKIHAEGSGAHAHSTYAPILDTTDRWGDSTGREALSASLAPAIPETAYQVLALVGDLLLMSSSSQSVYQVAVEIGASGGFQLAAAPWIEAANEVQAQTILPLLTRGDRSCGAFQRHVGDPLGLDLETARRWRFRAASKDSAFAAGLWVTYHAIRAVCAGNVKRYDPSGDGSGITVAIHDALTGDKLGSVVSAVGGGYSFTWYDDTREVYAEAWVSDSYRGRSSNYLPVAV